MNSIVEQIHRDFKTTSNYLKEGERSALKTVGLDNHVRAIDAHLRYPNHKLIHSTHAEQICSKYGLFCGKLDKYIGQIPNKNLKELEDFKLNVAPHYTIDYGFWGGQKKTYYKNLSEIRNKKSTEKRLVLMAGQFSICAPEKDFISGSRHILVDDPIILFSEYPRDYCYSSNMFVIVTAWGEEAKDEKVFNERLN